MKTEKFSILIGVVCSLVVSFFCFRYYKFKEQNESLRQSNGFYEAIESIDYQYNDLKYRARSESHAKARIALVALDEDSVTEIERWPWSRELMAQMTQKLFDYGVKSVGFDVIFSEAEKGNPKADPLFAEVVTKNKNKIVLGTKSDQLIDFLPYQDYCVNQAFLATRGNEIVKIGIPLVVNDDGNKFEELVWNDFFSQVFALVNTETEAKVLRSLQKKSVSELSQYQLNYLNSSKSNDIFEYCSVWLTERDPYLSPEFLPTVKPLYDQLFQSKATVLKGLEFQKAVEVFKNESSALPVPQRGLWTANISLLQEPAQHTASFIAKQDSDGPIRRYPLFYRSGNTLGSSYIPSLALDSYLVGMGYRADVQIEQVNGVRKITGFSIVNPTVEPEQKIAELPVDLKGQLLVNYYGKQMSVDYVPAKELFSEYDDMRVLTGVPNQSTNQINIQTRKEKKADYFKDRIVIVGATAAALYDLRSTPLEANYPGPEIHMTMLANLLEQKFIRNWNSEAKFMPLLVLLLGAALSLMWAHIGAMSSMLTLLLLYISTIGLDFFLFIKHNLLISGFFIIVQISIVYFTITVFKYFTEERKKAELKKTFSKYVSPAVVDEILKDPSNLKLGGRKQIMTVFFSDVRGFTTISEKLSPTDLSKLLNRYLTPMTEIVFANKGTLDKYMGDAVMAFFGAPIQDSDHAKQACRCALESLVKLKEIQDELKAENLPVIDIGIGINTGEMSVGNMGSNIVQNYTVMGDSVNLGSRLEGINKEYGTRIIISEFTYAEVKDDFITREIDRVKVKGKNEPVRIFELMAEKSLPEDKSKAREFFISGYQHYLAKRFDEAKAEFEKALSICPEDSVAELYIERCADYLAEPPPSDWDGVFVMKTK